MSDEVLETLRKVVLFSVLEEDELQRVAASCELVHVSLGEQVFEQGDAGDAFYVILSGKVRITRKPEPGAKDLTLANLGQGSYFGEVALIQDVPRTAGARASQDSTLLSLSRQDFRELLLGLPDVAAQLEQCVRNRSVQTFLRTCTEVGQQLKPKDFKKIVGALETISAPAGPLALAHPALYVVQSGRVELRAGGERKAVVEQGEAFGEDHVLDDPIGFEALAPGPVELLRVEAGLFRQLFKKSKGLKSLFQGREQRWRQAAGLSSKRASRGVSPSDSGRVAAPSGLTLMEMSVPVIDFEEDEVEEQETQAEVLPRRKGVIRRFPFIEQQEEMDCGAACLAMILKHYGKTVHLTRLRSLASVTAQGASMASIVEAAGKVGFVATGRAASVEALEHNERLPLIAHWEGVHWIVVYRISADHVWVSDPAEGKIKMSRAEFERGYTGRLVSLEPTTAIADVEESRIHWGRFVEPLKQHKLMILEIFACALALQIFGLTVPILTQQITDRVAVTKSASLLNLLAFAAALLFLGQIAIGAVRTYVITFVSTRLQHGMMAMVMVHLLHLPLSFFGLKRPGDILSRFEDSDEIKEVLLGKPIEIAIDLLLLVGYLGVMLYYNVTLTVVTLLFVLPFMGLTLVSAPIMAGFTRRNSIAESRTESTLIETFNGIETVKSFGIERKVRSKWEGRFARAENLSYAEEMIELGFESLTGLLDKLTKVTVLYIGVLQVIEGNMSIGQLLAFTMMVDHVYRPILGFVGLIDEFQEANVSAERLGEILDTPREVAPGVNLTKPRQLKGYIRYENVFFRYGAKDSPYVVRNVSLELAPGQTLALVGRSGSGKTTLARLLLGLYPITEGRIFIDEIDLSELDPQHLRRSVSTVPQDSYLFRGTILENIAAGDPNPDYEAVGRAASMAAAHDFVSDMPLGYQTQVGEGGGRLSGGQRQRIALARAFYRRPNILIMDESTSALDTESEATISENTSDFLKDRVAIVIAHRMSTVRNADKILVLDNGEILEQGNHEDLLAKEGLYYQLCTQQLVA